MVATGWQPVVEGDRVVGFQVRLLETMGRAGRVALRGLSRLAAARQLDLLGNTVIPLTTEGDALSVDFTAYEWVTVEGVFESAG